MKCDLPFSQNIIVTILHGRLFVRVVRFRIALELLTSRNESYTLQNLCRLRRRDKIVPVERSMLPKMKMVEQGDQRWALHLALSLKAGTFVNSNPSALSLWDVLSIASASCARTSRPRHCRKTQGLGQETFHMVEAS